MQDVKILYVLVADNLVMGKRGIRDGVQDVFQQVQKESIYVT